MSSILELSAVEEDGPVLHTDPNCYSIYAFVFQHMPFDRTLMWMDDTIKDKGNLSEAKPKQAVKEKKEHEHPPPLPNNNKKILKKQINFK